MARHWRVEVGRGVLTWLPITALIASVLLTGCGDDDDDAAAESTSATSLPVASTPFETSSTPQTAGLETFPPVDTDAPGGGGGAAGLGLPDGPNSPGEDRVRDVYDALREDRCDDAAENLNLNRHWNKFRSPRDVLIYQAAIDLCRGDSAQAAGSMAAATEMGLEGIAKPVATEDGTEDVLFAYYCEVYRSVRGALDGSPRDEVECPGGEPPGWPTGDEDERDDPRTPEDESSMSAGSDEDVTESTGATTSASTSDPPTSLLPETTQPDTATTEG